MSAGSPQRDSGLAAPTGRTPTDLAAQAADGPPASPPLSALVDAVVSETKLGKKKTAGPAEAISRLDRFLDETSPRQALREWFAFCGDAPPAKGQLRQRLGREIAQLDRMIGRQLDAILHHQDLQKLEASWRGLRYLVEQKEDAENVKIRVLNVSWKELARDVGRAIEFDQSQLFHKVYNEEYGMPGGEPYGVLLGDYQIESLVDDVETLEHISGVAAAAFAPFIAGAHPAMFGLNDFGGLEQPLNLAATFDQLEYHRWRSFRQREDARFVGLTLPHVLMRLPYEDDGSRIDGFVYSEDVTGPDREKRKHLWGNAVYGFGSVLVRAFGSSGWLADIRGVERDVERGGLVVDLPVHSFSTDKQGVAPKCSTDVIISDFREQEFSELGFIPLCHCPDTEFSAFYATQSAQKPKKYDTIEATINAKVSAMLQYTLCVSLFAHCLKVLGRDHIGTLSNPGELQDYLYTWLQQYVTPDPYASREVKAELPLREANVAISPIPGRPGSFNCIARLWPHFELDELVTALKVTTDLAPGQPP